MKRCWFAGKEAGVTLVELLVSTTVATLVLISLCEVYYLIGREWDRQHNKQVAITAASNALTELSKYVSQAVDVISQDRFEAGDTLAVLLPADSAYGAYVAAWDGERFRYRQGTWLIFYLSDETGSYWNSGDILWAATVTDWDDFPASVVPDTSWSLFQDTHAGKVAPISSLLFTVDESYDRPIVTIAVGTSYKVGKSIVSFVESRTQSVRNQYAL